MILFSLTLVWFPTVELLCLARSTARCWLPASSVSLLGSNAALCLALHTGNVLCTMFPIILSSWIIRGSQVAMSPEHENVCYTSGLPSFCPSLPPTTCSASAQFFIYRESWSCARLMVAPPPEYLSHASLSVQILALAHGASFKCLIPRKLFMKTSPRVGIFHF
jgi:hypothetical protein